MTFYVLLYISSILVACTVIHFITKRLFGREFYMSLLIVLAGAAWPAAEIAQSMRLMKREGCANAGYKIFKTITSIGGIYFTGGCGDGCLNIFTGNKVNNVEFEDSLYSKNKYRLNMTDNWSDECAEFSRYKGRHVSHYGKCVGMRVIDERTAEFSYTMEMSSEDKALFLKDITTEKILDRNSSTIAHHKMVELRAKGYIWPQIINLRILCQENSTKDRAKEILMSVIQ